MMNKRIKKYSAILLNTLGGYPTDNVHHFYLNRADNETCYACHFCLSDSLPAPTYDEVIDWLEKEHLFSLGVIPKLYWIQEGEFHFVYKACVMRYYKDEEYGDGWEFDFVSKNKEEVYEFALNQMLTILLHDKENK